MPPIRSLSASKPVKTERSHEENQERAYIAASRRSDRSLEARVESARRASEIHKRRTGRSLRVTEQDVVNEEMYEEEDDDLPLQYRRLTAHLNTNSSDFNRRLAAYLTNQVAMRTALDHAIASQYGGQPGVNGTPANQNAMQMHSPFMNNQQAFMPQQDYSMRMMPPNMMQQSPNPYRQAPYPMPSGQNFNQSFRQNRPNSVSVPGQTPVAVDKQSTPHSPSDTLPNGDQRRSSAPTEGPASHPSGIAPADQSNQQAQRKNSSSSMPSSSNIKLEARSRENSATSHGRNNSQDFAKDLAGHQAKPSPQNMPTPPEQPNTHPLSTSLPLETQQFLSPSFDFGSAMQSPQHWGPQPFYSYNPNNVKARNVHPSFDGMNQTLAPGALDTKMDQYSWSNPQSATTDSAMTPFSTNFPKYSYDQGFGGDGIRFPFDATSPLDGGSGLQTPDDQEWSTFIDSEHFQ